MLLLTLLAGCAPPAPPPSVQATPQAPLLKGTILAMRAVPEASPEAVGVLLSDFGIRQASVAGGTYEFIVRTTDDTTLAIVQPHTTGLYPGEHVSILPGPQPRIATPAID